MDADNEFGTVDERAGRPVGAPSPGCPEEARGPLSRGAAADERRGAAHCAPSMGSAAAVVSARGPQGPSAAEVPRPPADTTLEDPSAEGVEGSSVRGSLGAVGDASVTGAGTSIRGLLDAAQEETRLARSHQARAARLAALAARLAEEQKVRS
ncbi:MAG: hypothetical protein LBK95_08020, partial [Bifidobacteriaceae bacterium]|nr:hypothetical protein [Bifidobacteriaceae bacterium]